MNIMSSILRKFWEKLGQGLGWQRLMVIALVTLVCVGCSGLPTTTANPWEIIQVPTTEKLLDIAFTGNSNHGFLVGGNSTLLETQDGGNTWNSLNLQLDDQLYRFNAVSFSGDEGWVTGEPSLMLHTTDGGKSWSRIPLSNQLPGNPVSITALGSKSAEMVTDVGAIYRTTDSGLNWKSQVEDAVGVLRNLKRSSDGRYVAVSAKGNFYSTWTPGQDSWVPQNRNSSRRVENMGFDSHGQLWMLARGGQIQFTVPDQPEEWQEAFSPERSASWGLLDMAYRTPDEIWAAGGGGTLLRSPDNGKTWEKDLDVAEVPGNLFKIVFISPERGYILSDRGVILKYNPSVATAG